MTMLQIHPVADTHGTGSGWGEGDCGAMSIGLGTTGGRRGPKRAAATAERRRGLRVSQARPVKVLDAMGGRTIVGETVNVSATGLQVSLPPEASLQVGEVLGIAVGLSRIGERLANRRQMIPVRVVWVRATTGKRAGVVAGVEFATGIGAQLDAA